MGVTSARAGRWTLAAIAVGLGATVEAIAARHGQTTTYAGSSSALAALELTAAWGMVAAGLLAWRRRPLGGAVAVAAGLAWLAPDLVGWDAGPAGLRSVAALLAGVTFAAVVHLVAALPSGRLSSRPARALVAAVYAELAVVAVVRAIVRDPFRDPDCWSTCAGNVLAIFPDPDLAHALTRADLAFTIAAAIALGVLAAAHGRAASRIALRALAPVLIAGVAFALLQGAWAAQLLSTPLENPDRGTFAALFAARCAALVALSAALGWAASRAWRANTSLARLVRELGQMPAPGQLQTALARVVGDPTLTVGYRVGDRYVDARGDAISMPEPNGARSVTSIERHGQPVAVVLHEPAALGAPDLASEIGAAARVAVDNERLQAQSRAQLQELRASRTRIVETADTARERLERDLHDGAQQRLVSLSLMLLLARDSLHPGATEPLDAAAVELREAIVELRELAHGIHAAALSEEGLGPAIRALADRTPLTIRALELPGRRLAPAVEHAAYALVDEIARGGASVTVAIRLTEDAVEVELQAEREAGALTSVHDRIRALDGRLETGDGRVLAWIPCGPGSGAAPPWLRRT